MTLTAHRLGKVSKNGCLQKNERFGYLHQQNCELKGRSGAEEVALQARSKQTLENSLFHKHIKVYKLE